MSELKGSFHESVIIKRARRRLIGAIAILIILFTLSLFFVKNTEKKDTRNKIKVSFLEMGSASFNRKENIEKKEFIELSSEGLKNKTNSVKKLENSSKIFTVQIGIFSDEIRTQQLSNQINDIGFKTEIKKINLLGQEKIKLTTQFFNSKKEAQKALRKLKNANFPGLIKHQ
jgi:cell division protein FtsN